MEREVEKESELEIQLDMQMKPEIIKMQHKIEETYAKIKEKLNSIHCKIELTIGTSFFVFFEFLTRNQYFLPKNSFSS